MKKTTLVIILMSLMLAITGCVNWADQNKPVDIIPEILSAIEEAKVRPIELTETQKSKLFSSLAGPVKKEFMASDLRPEVWASWFNQRDRVTFVRYTKNDERYAFVSYGPDGRVFAVGGGRRDSAHPPWKR